MSVYQTKQLFGGRPAVVNADIIVAAQKHNGAAGEICLRAGKILMISESKDLPYVHDLSLLPRHLNGTPEGMLTVHVENWRFHEVNSVEGFAGMAVNTWTWPITLAARASIAVEPPTGIPHGPPGVVYYGLSTGNVVVAVQDDRPFPIVWAWSERKKQWVVCDQTHIILHALQDTVSFLLKQRT